MKNYPYPGQIRCKSTLLTSGRLAQTTDRYSDCSKPAVFSTLITCLTNHSQRWMYCITIRAWPIILPIILLDYSQKMSHASYLLFLLFYSKIEMSQWLVEVADHMIHFAVPKNCVESLQILSSRVSDAIHPALHIRAGLWDHTFPMPSSHSQSVEALA
jgi:hypothetical protein